MERSFGEILAELRHEKGLNQRELANDLHISQALLSHYEKGTREPGLPFVGRVCDYFGVTADFVLGRSERTDIPVFSGATAELNRALMDFGEGSVKDAALAYVDAAAQKMTCRLTFHDEAELLAKNVEMAQAELALVRALPPRHSEK
ncbi:MAG: helix-turn-helix domain-containing protein [Oscillospiraceae bacterium]|jgi:transcriptional regulator with XRE-family HTH domain